MRQVILNFHGIGSPGRDLEPGEANYWVDENFFVEVLDMMDHFKDRVRVDLTFDDGNLSDLAIAHPHLKQRGRTAEIFVLADRIGQPGSLDVADMRTLVAEGSQIGTHGAAHIDWAGADADTLAHELGPATRDALAAAAGHEITAAAIPFGRYNARVLRALRQAGYARAYSSDGGAWNAGQWPIPRTSPRADMQISDIEAVLLGHEPLKTRVRRQIAQRVKRVI